MANKVYFNENTNEGRDIRELLDAGQKFRDLLRKVRGSLIQSRNNDGSADADYQPLVDNGIFSTIGSAHTAVSEIDSVYGRQFNDGSVTLVSSSFQQMLDILG